MIRQNAIMSHLLKDITRYAKKEISQETQKMLNTPLPSKLGDEHRQYFSRIVKMLQSGKIDLLSLKSILNSDIYKRLSSQDQGIIDLAGINILHHLRTLAALFASDYHDTYQTRLIVEKIWETKERIEQKYGNVYIV